MRQLIFPAAMVAALASPGSALAEPGDFLIKVRGGIHIPAGTDNVQLQVYTTQSPTTLVPIQANTKSSAGAEAAIDYFITDQLVAEFSFGGASYSLKTPNGGKVLTAGKIIPAMSLLYRASFDPRIAPYFGAGASYVKYFNEKAGSVVSYQSGSSYPAGLESKVAPFMQLGADIPVSDKVFVNIDGKYIIAKSKLNIVRAASIQVSELDGGSIVLGAGLGFRF